MKRWSVGDSGPQSVMTIPDTTARDNANALPAFDRPKDETASVQRLRSQALPLGAETDATIEAAIDSMVQAHGLLATSCSLLLQGVAVSQALAGVRRAH